MEERKKVPVFEVPLDAYEQFEQLVKSEGKSIAQGLRDAMKEYGAHRNVPLQTDVGEWGGLRERPKQ